MEKPLLLLYHAELGDLRPPISFRFPEPRGNEKIHILNGMSLGKNWKMSKLDFIGEGRLVSFRNYSVNTDTTFYSEISEECLCLRIQTLNESFNGFHHLKHLWQEDECIIFWNIQQSLNSYLLPGEHMHFDLFIRLDQILKFKHIETVKGLLDKRPMSSDPGMFHRCKLSPESTTFLCNMMEELERHPSPDTERFNNLCDSLLFNCLGENVPSDLKNKNNNVGNREYKNTIWENSHVLAGELDELSRTELFESVISFKNILCELKLRWKNKETIAASLRSMVRKSCSPYQELLGTSFIQIAYLFELIYQEKLLEEKDEPLITKAIEIACLRSFEFRIPNFNDMELFTKWSGKPYNFPAVGNESLYEIYAMIGITNAEDLINENTERGNKLLTEQLKEAFGYMSFKEFNREHDSHKPIEIIQLYGKLLEYFSDTLEIEKDGLGKSQIIKELDAAFDNNDILVLLQIEIEYLVHDTYDLNDYDQERLKWYFIAILNEYQEYDKLLSDMEINQSFYELHKYYELGGDLKKFEMWTDVQVNLLEHESCKLSNYISNFAAGINRETSMVLVYDILNIDSYRGKLPTI